MLAIQRMEPECIFSKSTSPADWIPDLGENCAVCGDRVNSTRLGSPACLGCIVFFRRSIIHSSKYRCLRDGNCLINYGKLIYQLDPYQKLNISWFKKNRQFS